MGPTLSLALAQMKVGLEKEKNLTKAQDYIKMAAEAHADIIILPEVFNAPYQIDLFPDYAETYPGPSAECIAAAARKNKITVVAGSMIEKGEDGCLFNTSFVFGEAGELLARHRKIHLFDIDIPGEISFKESTLLTAGQDFTLFSCRGIMAGLIICYDCRFPELSRLLAMQGAQIIVMPGNFNMISGPRFWELTLRARAVDNQVYFAGVSAARDDQSSYRSWGHSMLVDPAGNILTKGGAEETLLLQTIDLQVVDQVRAAMPLLQHRRTDLYELKCLRPLQGESQKLSSK